MKAAAFLFDLDGTLVDTEGLWVRAIVMMAKDRSVEVGEDVIANLIVGHSWLDIHAALKSEYPSARLTTPSADAVELRAYYNRLAVNPKETIIPGSVEFLKEVAKIAPVAIVSGSPHDDVVAAAEVCGIKESLAFVLGAEDYERGKPAPDGFLKAAEMLGVPPEECVVVEDSSAGIASGVAAGMRVIALARANVIPQNRDGAEMVVENLSSIDIAKTFR